MNRGRHKQTTSNFKKIVTTYISNNLAKNNFELPYLLRAKAVVSHTTSFGSARWRTTITPNISFTVSEMCIHLRETVKTGSSIISIYIEDINGSKISPKLNITWRG